MKSPTKQQIDEAILLVKQYLIMEYDSGIASQIDKSKFIGIVRGFVKNSISLNNKEANIPNIANNLAKFIKDTM